MSTQRVDCAACMIFRTRHTSQAEQCRHRHSSQVEQCRHRHTQQPPLYSGCPRCAIRKPSYDCNAFCGALQQRNPGTVHPGILLFIAFIRLPGTRYGTKLCQVTSVFGSLAVELQVSSPNGTKKDINPYQALVHTRDQGLLGRCILGSMNETEIFFRNVFTFLLRSRVFSRPLGFGACRRLVCVPGRKCGSRPGSVAGAPGVQSCEISQVKEGRASIQLEPGRPMETSSCHFSFFSLHCCCCLLLAAFSGVYL